MRYPRIPLLICIFYLIFSGCQSSKETNYLSQDISSFRDKKISAVTLKNGEVRKYDKVGARYYEEKRDSGYVRKIIGFDVTGNALNIDLDRVLEVQSQTTETDGGATFLAAIFIVGGGLFVLALLIAATFRGFSVG